MAARSWVRAAGPACPARGESNDPAPPDPALHHGRSAARHGDGVQAPLGIDLAQGGVIKVDHGRVEGRSEGQAAEFGAPEGHGTTSSGRIQDDPSDALLAFGEAKTGLASETLETHLASMPADADGKSELSAYAKEFAARFTSWSGSMPSKTVRAAAKSFNSTCLFFVTKTLEGFRLR